MTNLSTRVIKHYINDSFTDDKPSELELSVFTLKDGRHFDIGAMCYRAFDFHTITSNRDSDHLRQTDLETLDKKRLKFLSNLIDYMRLKNHIKHTSKRIKLLSIMRFIQWIGTQDFECNFEIQGDVKIAYEEYTKWLFHRTKLKDGNPLKLRNNTASFEQKTARLACSLITDVSVDAIEYWSTPIRFNDRDSFTGTLTNTPTTDEDKHKTYAALCDFIHQVWSFWVKNKHGSVTVNNFTLYEKPDLYDQYKREEIYNKTIVAAILSFIGATGANLQVAVESTLDNYHYGQAKKNTRLSGVKSRAGGKVVNPEFAAKYLNVWKKWLDIREIWLSTHGETSDFAFPYRGKSESIKAIPSSLTDVTKTAANMFIQHYGVNWFTARAWRGFKSKLLGKSSSGDIFSSADMQGHTIETAVRHYTNRNLADAAKEISSALNAVYDSAIRRSRYREKIPVTLIKTQDPNQATVIGSCLSEETLSPAIADGFTNFAPQPDCSIKETCLFCEKYAAHADKKDIKKLLSFSFLVNELSKQMPQTEWANRWSPYIHRVSEILSEMKATRPSIETVIKKVSEEIEYGELDDFWMDYYETLSHLGIVTT